MARPIQDCAILFGDSLTSRQDVPGSLQARMSDSYRRNMDILNRGYGGYNTITVRPLFDQIFARKDEAADKSKVKLVTIWFGANDAVLHGKNRQHVPLPTFVDILDSFVDDLTSPTSKYPVVPNIILITPPPIYAPMMENDQSFREPATSIKYRDGVLELAQRWKMKEKKGSEWKVGVIDLWDAMVKDSGGLGEELREYFTDGLHLSGKAYDVLWKEYLKLVHGEFKGRDLDWQVIPGSTPGWSDLDPSRPELVLEGMMKEYRRA